MADITVYEKPTCTTCRKLFELLTERGVDFDRVEYLIEPLTEDELRALLAKAHLGPRDVLRKGEPLYIEMGLASGEHSDDELFAILARHPEVLQRPIVEKGDHAVLARPPEKVLELLD